MRKDMNAFARAIVARGKPHIVHRFDPYDERVRWGVLTVESAETFLESPHVGRLPPEAKTPINEKAREWCNARNAA